MAGKGGVLAVALVAAAAGGVCGQKPAPAEKTPAAKAAAKASVPVKFLLEYQGQGDSDVRNDPQFVPLLERALPQRQSFEYGMTLAKTIQYYLGVGSGRVTVDDGRYAVVTGCVPHLCDTSQGFLWVDTQSAPANVLFVAIDPMAGSQAEGSTASYHLWIFGSLLLHADSDHLDALPDDFIKTLQQEVGELPVASATFVEPNGAQIPLLPQQSLHLGQAAQSGQSGSLKGSQ
jgi:hypothetical protein